MSIDVATGTLEVAIGGHSKMPISTGDKAGFAVMPDNLSMWAINQRNACHLAGAMGRMTTTDSIFTDALADMAHTLPYKGDSSKPIRLLPNSQHLELRSPVTS